MACVRIMLLNNIRCVTAGGHHREVNEKKNAASTTRSIVYLFILLFLFSALPHPVVAIKGKSKEKKRDSYLIEGAGHQVQYLRESAGGSSPSRSAPVEASGPCRMMSSARQAASSG